MHVVITGANRGIGQALMQRYVSRGDEVTGTARNKDGFAHLDVTRPEDHHAFAKTLSDKPIDLLICNAGVYMDKGQELDGGYPAQMWADTFAANVTGVFLTVQSLLPNLRLAKHAKIAVISSQMASHERAPGNSYVYRASKAAALNVGRNLAAELSNEGIAVGIYHPGWVSTEMGGDVAPTTVDQSADGLVLRFDELDMASTGCFRTYEGLDHPY